MQAVVVAGLGAVHAAAAFGLNLGGYLARHGDQGCACGAWGCATNAQKIGTGINQKRQPDPAPIARAVTGLGPLAVPRLA